MEATHVEYSQYFWHIIIIILLKFPNFKNAMNFPSNQIITICSY